MLSKGFVAVNDPTIGYLGTGQMFKSVKSPVFYLGTWLWLCLVGFLGHLPWSSLSLKLA